MQGSQFTMSLGELLMIVGAFLTVIGGLVNALWTSINNRVDRLNSQFLKQIEQQNSRLDLLQQLLQQHVESNRSTGTGDKNPRW